VIRSLAFGWAMKWAREFWRVHKTAILLDCTLLEIGLATL